MSEAGRVKIGFSKPYVARYSNTGNKVTYSGLRKLARGVDLNIDPSSSDSNDFYADNIAYWSGYSGGTIEGDLEVAMFDDEFKTQFLGYKELTSGGLASVKNATKPNVFVAFQVEGDQESRRCILYNCSLGAINREYSTITENKEPQTATIPVTCIGDNVSGVTMATFKPTDSGYATLFTAPTAPAIATD